MTSVVVTDPIAEIESGDLPMLRDDSTRAVPALPAISNSIELLALAVQRGVSVGEMKELVALHDHMEKRAAAKAFADAKARFLAKCPKVTKNAKAEFTTRGGGEMSYTYASIDRIAEVVNGILAEEGLSYRWDQSVTGGQITVVCTLSHRDGHSETSTLALPTDSASAMSSQQKVGAAMTFAQRRTLSAVLGITTADEDTDGRDAPPQFVTGEQADELYALVERAGVDPAKFLKWAGAESFAKVLTNRLADAVANLNEKIAKREGGK